jgi:hypothetical protein
MSKRKAMKAKTKRRKFLKEVIKNIISGDRTDDDARKLDYYENQLKRL